jgi:voltage-gated potassium channel
MTDAPPARSSLRQRLTELYHGGSAGAVQFRTAWLILDLIIIGFFIAAPLIRDSPIFLIIDYAIAALLAVDLIARAVAWTGPGAFLRRFSVWIDVLVLLTLLFPETFFNLGFLRVLRLYTLVNSEVFWETILKRFDDTRVEEITRAVAALLTFVFVCTGFVYTTFLGAEGGPQGYVDALYFTMTTLTTTGYGDITLPGATGQLLSIAIMVSGVTLFLRLAQAIFQPNKVRFRCPTCGLGKHDPDAVHCKACGEGLNIPNDS